MMGILDRLRPRGEAPQTSAFDFPFATSSNTADSSEKASESSMLYGTLTISTTPAAAATAIGQTPVPKASQRASLLKRRSRSTTASNAAAAASPSTAMDVNLGIHAQLNAASSPTKSNGGGGGGAGDKTRSFASSSSLSSRFTSDSRRHLPVSPSLKSDVPDFPARSDSLQGLCITTNGNEIVGAVGYPQPGDSEDAASTSMVIRNGSRAYCSLRTAKATASGGGEHDNVQTSSTALGSVRSARSVASACDGWDEDHPTQMSKRKWKSTLLKSKRPQTADAARGHSVSSTSKPHPRRSIDGVRQSSKVDQESTGDANTHARHDHSGTSEKTNSPEVSYAAVKVVMPSISANSNTSNAQSVAGKPSRSRSGTISASTYILRQFAASNAQQPSTTSSAPKTQETDVEKMLRSDSRASTSLHQAVDRLLDVDGECFDGRALIRIIMDTVKMLAEMATRPPNNTKNVGKKTRITLARPHTSSGAPLTITTTTTTTTSTLWEIATCQMESAVMSRLDAVTVSFASRQSLVDRAFELDLAFEQARDLLGLDACSRRVTSALSALIEARGKLFAGDDVHVYSSSPHRQERVASQSVVLRPAPRRGRSRCKVAERAEQVDCDFSSATSSPSSGRRSPYASQNRPFRTPTLVQPDEWFPSLQQMKGDDETNEEHDANTAYRPSTLSVISIQPLTPLTPSTDLFSSQSSALASAPSSPLTEISSNNSSRSSRCQVLAPDAFSTASMMRRRQKRPSYRDPDNLSFTHVQMPAPRMTANC